MLEELLKCDFTDTGVILPKDGSIDQLKAYTFMHEAIADDHLPVYKVVGFQISTFYKDSSLLPVTERNPCVLESWVEIAANLQDLVILNPDSLHIAVSNITGPVDLTPENQLFKGNGKPVRILYKEPHIMTAIDPVTLELWIANRCGYKTMADNVAIINSSFFPMNSRHSINDYVRVCPPKPGSGMVEYRKSKSVKAEDIKDAFLRLYGAYYAHELKGGDYKWLSSYER